MVETSNLMENKKLKAYPEIFNYVFSVYSFVKGKQSEASYQAWHSSVDKMLDAKNINKFKDFIEFSAGFFSESTLASATNSKWMYKGGKYTFEYTDKPYIRFEGGKLMCVIDNEGKNREAQPYSDSVVVRGATGTFSPIDKEWKGKGGTIDWQKVGLPKDKTFAVLQSYKVEMKSGKTLRVDSVLLTTPYFVKPIYGKLTDAASTSNRMEDKVFPQFNSFEKRLTIKNIAEDMDYDGGFSLKGADFVGVGTVAEPAKLIVYKETKTFIKVSALMITVSPKRISAFPGQVVINYAIKDSIYHPGLDFGYDIEKKTFEFNRAKTGIAQTPFSDSYHVLDMYVPRITWTKGSADLQLTYGLEIGQEQRIARLESKNFYDGRLYDQLAGLSTIHPLVMISNYCYKYDKYVLTEGEITTALGGTIGDQMTKSLILQLSGLGFITYDSEAKSVVVNDKTMNFIKAKSGKQDFDNLSFISDLRPKAISSEYTREQIEKDKRLQIMDSTFKATTATRRTMANFGTLSLTNLTIVMEAVDMVKLSEQQGTAVFPRQKPSNDQKGPQF